VVIAAIAIAYIGNEKSLIRVVALLALAFLTFGFVVPSHYCDIAALIPRYGLD
jgi:hypothetical protein